MSLGTDDDEHTESAVRWAAPRLACDLPIEREDTFVHNELVLSGWAISPAGISGVVVQVDDRLLHASYGLDTPSLAENLPEISGSDRAGYRLQIDTSAWERGRHAVIVTAYDQEGGRADVTGEVEVVPFSEPRYTPEENRAAIEAGEVAMWLERPSPVETSELAAPVEIAGWAYAAGGVETVLVTLDGHVRHEALHPVFRPDLLDDYGEEVARQAGFLLKLDPRDCPPGWHRLSVVATDDAGHAVGLETNFRCLPEPDPDSPPAPGEPASIDWLPEPRTASRLEPDAADAALGEADRRLLDWLASRVSAGDDTLDAGPDEVGTLPHDDASFDLVTCFGALDGATDPDAALEELRRVLRDDGVLLIAAARRARDTQSIPGGLERALRDRFANVRVARQRTLLASVITTDTSLSPNDVDTGLDLEVLTFGDERPGGEDYTLALASDANLPEIPAAAMLAPSSAVWRLRGTIAMWRDRALLAEADAAASRTQANIARMHQEATLFEWRVSERELEAARAELAAAQAQAADAERQKAELAERQSALAAAERRADAAEATLTTTTASLSWRITRPLRAVKQATRRLTRR